ncbi:MAG: HlyD family secretion protein [Planctomycetota bacterium]
MIRFLRNWTLPVISLALLLFGITPVLQANRDMPSVPPPAPPPRSPFGDSIAASGLIEPRSENISIGSPFSGVIQEVFVNAEKVGSTVRQGDPLFRIDDRHLRAQLAVEQALLATPRAQLQRLDALPRPEEVKPAEFRVVAAQARLQSANDAFERAMKLRQNAALPEAEIVAAIQEKEFAVAELARAESELALLKAGAWVHDRHIIEADVQAIEARIQQIQTEIDRSLVRAPLDGVVLQVNIRPGEFVGTPASKDLIVLGDMGQPHVRVDVDENDIPRFRPGSAASAIVRGSADDRLEIDFVRVEPYVIPKQALTGNNTERVDTRVLQVIFAVRPNQTEVFVGQQVDVFIKAEPIAGPGLSEANSASPPR